MIVISPEPPCVKEDGELHVLLLRRNSSLVMAPVEQEELLVMMKNRVISGVLFVGGRWSVL